MHSTHIKLELNISALEGKVLPSEEDILHHLTELLYDQIIGDSGVVDLVHVTEVDGKPTNE